MSEERPEPKFSWFIPIDGDGDHIGTLRPERLQTIDYLKDVVETAEKKRGVVVDELKAYWDLGIDEFILSGYPHVVEEARRVADQVLPEARSTMW